MKFILTFALILSVISTASAASLKSVLAAKNARECHTQIGNLALYKVSSAKSDTTALEERLNSFVAAETGCNEETEINSTERARCHTDLYARESIQLINKYKLGKFVSSIKSCKVLSQRQTN